MFKWYKNLPTHSSNPYEWTRGEVVLIVVVSTTVSAAIVLLVAALGTFVY